MFEPWLLRAKNGAPGLTPPTGAPTLVLALGMPPATLAWPVRVMLPPEKGSFPPGMLAIARARVCVYACVWCATEREGWFGTRILAGRDLSVRRAPTPPLQIRLQIPLPPPSLAPSYASVGARRSPCAARSSGRVASSAACTAPATYGTPTRSPKGTSSLASMRAQ